jgi:peptidyl-prolyl cis-trans isomerase SurA
VNGRPILNASTWLIAAALLTAPPPAAGQLPGMPGADPEFVDRVVAVVGDSAVVMSQVTERMFQLGQELPTDSASLDELQRQVLEALVNEQLLLQAALKDTLITVDDDRINAIVDDELEQRTRTMGGQAAMQRALSQQGWTLTEYREYLQTEARKQDLQQQYLARQAAGRRAVIVEESEMREFFESQRDALPERPATITFANIVLNAEAADSAKAAAMAEAEEILEQILAGEEFEELARRHSDDPGSQQLGGDLGWFRRGSGFVKEFEDAAFQLRPGQVSVPIETEFGYHVIKVERVRGPERKARHILVQPEVTQEDLERTRTTATEIRTRLEQGEAFGALQDQYGAGPIPDTTTVATDQLNQLPPGYSAALVGASTDAIVGPIEFGQGGRTSFGLAQVIEVREAGIASFDDVRSEIHDVLSQQKMQERILEELRSAAHVEIRI